MQRDSLVIMSTVKSCFVTDIGAGSAYALPRQQAFHYYRPRLRNVAAFHAWLWISALVC
jgi:hypothetical protein